MKNPRITSWKWLRNLALVALPVVLCGALIERRSWLARTLVVRHEIFALDWADNNEVLAVRALEQLQMWDIQSQSLKRSIKLDEGGLQMLFANKNLLALETDSRNQMPCAPGLDLRNIQTGARLHSLKLRWPFAFSPDARQITATTGKGKVSFDLKTLDVSSAKIQKTVHVTVPNGFYLTENAGPGGCGGSMGCCWFPHIALSRNGKTGAISLLQDGKTVGAPPYSWKPSQQAGVLLFDARSARHLYWLPTSKMPWQIMDKMSFSPDGKTLILTGSSSSTSSAMCQLWEVATGRLLLSLKEKTVTNAILVADLSPDNKVLATADSRSTIVRLWEARTGRLLRQLTGHTKSITCLAFSPDGRTLATAGEDGTAKLWRIR